MNFERLKKLADLLDKHHGQPNEHGFIVVPQSDRQLDEHTSALVHRNSIFHYEPEYGERLGICSVTRRDTEAGKMEYTPTRLEYLDHAAFTAADIRPLLDEYMEYVRSKAVR